MFKSITEDFDMPMVPSRQAVDEAAANGHLEMLKLLTKLEPEEARSLSHLILC